jgi:hypothetical protein
MGCVGEILSCGEVMGGVGEKSKSWGWGDSCSNALLRNATANKTAVQITCLTMLFTNYYCGTRESPFQHLI